MHVIRAEDDFTAWVEYSKHQISWKTRKTHVDGNNGLSIDTNECILDGNHVSDDIQDNTTAALQKE